MKQTETPQAARDGLATPVPGGAMPGFEDVINAANARGGKRHDVKSNGGYADEGVLPDTGKMAGNEMVGIKDSGYLVKKGLKFGVSAHYNSLPPGMNIEDQENTDQRKMTMKTWGGGLSFPGDGWS